MTQEQRVTTVTDAKNELLRRNRVLGHSWEKISQDAKYYGIPKSSLWAFATGRRDLADKHKARLGIVYEKLTPVCPYCNEVHTHKCRKHKPEPPAWVTRGADFLERARERKLNARQS